MKNRKELEKILEKVFRERTSAQWREILDRHDVPNGPINTYEDVFQDPQVQRNRIALEIGHEVLGSFRYVGLPFHLMDTPGGPQNPPPMVGEHTVEVLTGLGLSQEEIAKLREEGVI
jgi:crotonobetainyl-CoA:carnitine CoA-transferase CaiB-like acyl-CoA transferase